MKTSEYMQVALDIAKQSGEIIRTNFVRNMKKEWKGDDTPVTETDHTINALVLNEIKNRYPSHSIISEEGNDHDESHEYVWICDPVDGTHNFSHGVPTATFALALMHERVPVLGVILDPFEDRVYYAEKGSGAFLNGESIRVSSDSSIKKTMIGVGKTRSVKNLFPAMDAIYQKGAHMITGLSIHFLSSLVASGEFSASIFGGTSPHDMTPAKVIIEEAGGRVTDMYGNTPTRFDTDMPGQVCSNGFVHDELLSILALGPDLKKVGA